MEVGAYASVPATGDILVYPREHDGARFFVALNFGSKPDLIDLGPTGPRGTVVVGAHRDREGESIEDRIELRADEGIVLKLAV